MGKTQSVKKTMRDHLHGTVSRVCVPDIYGKMLPDCNTSEELANGFIGITASDGVHLNQDGYGILAECIMNTLTEQMTSGTSVSGGRPGDKPRDFYWRGFVSPVGSERPSHYGSYHGNRGAGRGAGGGAGGGKWKSYSTTGSVSSSLYTSSAVRGKPPTRRPSRGRNWH